MIGAIRKQPAEVIRVVFDYTLVLSSSATVSSISSIAAAKAGVVSGSGDVTLSGQASAGKKASVLVAGGTSGESYKVTARVQDSDSQTHELEGIVEVVDA